MRSLALLILLAIASPAFAGEHLARLTPALLGGSVAAAGLSCTGATVQQAETSIDGESNWAMGPTLLWRASQFTYSGTTGTLCRIDININCTTTDCTQILTGHLYGDNGADEVGSLLGTCSGTYDTAPLETGDTWISFTGCSGTVTNGTKYWWVGSSNWSNGTNYIKLSNDNNCATEKIGYSSDGASWAYTVGTVCAAFRLYILE